jgi:hypothetical protein
MTVLLKYFSSQKLPTLSKYIHGAQASIIFCLKSRFWFNMRNTHRDLYNYIIPMLPSRILNIILLKDRIQICDLWQTFSFFDQIYWKTSFIGRVGWMVVVAYACGPQNKPNVHHGFIFAVTITYFVFVLGSRTKQFLCCMYLVEVVWSYRQHL